MKPYELDKLTDYFLSLENVRSIVYFGYVIVLLVINYYNFQDLTVWSSLTMDRAILQSFLTFIAVERALIFLKTLNFRPSVLLEKISSSILSKIKDADKI